MKYLNIFRSQDRKCLDQAPRHSLSYMSTTKYKCFCNCGVVESEWKSDISGTARMDKKTKYNSTKLCIDNHKILSTQDNTQAAFRIGKDRRRTRSTAFFYFRVYFPEIFHETNKVSMEVKITTTKAFSVLWKYTLTSMEICRSHCLLIWKYSWLP